MIAVKCEQGKLLSCTEFYCMFQNMYEEEKVLYCLKVNRFYSDKIVKSNKAAVVVERRKFGAVGYAHNNERPNLHYIIYITICLYTAAHNTRQKVSACLCNVYSSFKLWTLYINEKVDHLANITILFMTSINYKPLAMWFGFV